MSSPVVGEVLAAEVAFGRFVDALGDEIIVQALHEASVAADQGDVGIDFTDAQSEDEDGFETQPPTLYAKVVGREAIHFAFIGEEQQDCYNLPVSQVEAILSARAYDAAMQAVQLPSPRSPLDDIL
ncbi:MAG TPA: hypothetical protein VLE73_05130 [Candidatus Saccharimonadales bacterium]|nr:hypothetical protein [Candidatus Saccharimonadales bacterium]